MAYTVLEPEVAGGWGDNTVADVSVHPPIVSHLHYEFHGWLGDDILESFPCFIVTERLADEMRARRLSGYELAPVEVSTTPDFRGWRAMTTFLWLRVTGTAGESDYGLYEHRLVVSDRAMATLEMFQLEHAERAPFGPAL